MFKRVGVSALIAGCFLGVFANFSIASEGDAFHFDVGISYTSGANNVNKAIKNGYEDFAAAESASLSYSSITIPVGLRLDPYYLFGNGIGIGAGIGPIQIGAVENLGNGISNGYSYYGIIPVGLDVRYEFINAANVDPYVRVGARYPVNFGNLVSDARIGAFGAIGVEFPTMFFGLEVSCDTSTVQAGYDGYTRRVMPNEIMASIFFHF